MNTLYNLLEEPLLEASVNRKLKRIEKKNKRLQKKHSRYQRGGGELSFDEWKDENRRTHEVERRSGYTNLSYDDWSNKDKRAYEQYKKSGGKLDYGRYVQAKRLNDERKYREELRKEQLNAIRSQTARNRSAEMRNNMEVINHFLK